MAVMTTLVILFILAINSVIAEEASSKVPKSKLLCYKCHYYDGFPGSDLNCLKDPDSSKLVTCSGPDVKDEMDRMIQGLPDDNNKVVLCLKSTGSIGGKKVVIRDCYNGSTEVNNPASPCSGTENVNLFGPFATDVQTCLCSSDKCNGQISTLHSVCNSVLLLAMVTVTTFFMLM